jgi:aldehyde:ferredoxin oxidoreductase
MDNLYGYAGKYLRVNLEDGSVATEPTQSYRERFIGGRGIGAKIYWDRVSPETEALSANNHVILSNGPLAGVPGLAGSRWQICGKARLVAGDRFSYANGGGSLGAWLKFAGYDAVEIFGASDRPVYLLIEDDKAELRHAPELWGKGTYETREILKAGLGKDTRVAAIGPAGEAGSVMATLVADDDASASSGFGAVLGYKKLKAIAIRTSNRHVNVARPDQLRILVGRFRQMSRGSRYIYSGSGGPTRNPGVARLDPDYNQALKKTACYGCGTGCTRSWYQIANNGRVKILCVSAAFYSPWVIRQHGSWNDTAFQASRLCNDCGLDTNSLMPLISWLDRCFKAGIINEKETGLPLSQIGTLEFLKDMAEKICKGEGFGRYLASGIFKAAEEAGAQARTMVKEVFPRTGQIYPYEPRHYLTTGLLYVMEPRLATPLAHEVVFPAHWWLDHKHNPESDYFNAGLLKHIANEFMGSDLALDFSTWEGKALAAVKIQNRESIKECLILCDFAWPVMKVTESDDHRGDPSLPSQTFTAVTGQEIDQDGLDSIGERVFNLQRAILVREGHEGRKDDRLQEYEYSEPLTSGLGAATKFRLPGKNAEEMSRAGAVIERTEFESIKEEFYRLRGWDVATGLQTSQKLISLGLSDIAAALKKLGLAV